MLSDTRQAWVMQGDGSYRPRAATNPGDTPGHDTAADHPGTHAMLMDIARRDARPAEQ